MKYKDKHLVKIINFIDYVKINAPVETTVKYITKEFFNGNKEFYQDSVNKLKSAHVLMTNNSYCKGKGQKWYYIENDVDINKLFNVPVNQVPVNQVPVVNVPVNQVPVNQVPVNQVPLNQVTVTINYKGMYKVTETITKEDKVLARNIKDELGSLFTDTLFFKKAQELGWNKEKSWYFFDLFVKKEPYENLFD